MLPLSLTALIGCTEPFLSTAAPDMEGLLWADQASLPLWGENCSFFIRICGVFRLSCNSDDTSSTQTMFFLLLLICCVMLVLSGKSCSVFWHFLIGDLWWGKKKKKRTLTLKTIALVSLSHVSVKCSDERLGSFLLQYLTVSVLPRYHSACSHNL